ncbi:holo-ACP synthase [Pleionea mediterranea]|uniref:Holo-[acyl-carrier-protein] synthase n=1 Tax=Pleionea mediterranea TaxID=523701 RepID=A0A316G0Z9_9GAMM|nr:holo-ACP synthase [Pleionea mediterranea]PWK54478.1 holo-[acyl-carrier protein] synthase [Pleionea mediterranea]
MAIVGIGTDIVEISRVEKSFKRFGKRFAERILSNDELTSKKFKVQPAHFLAKRFAAKEAIMKALGTGLAKGVRFDDFTVLNDENGKPVVDVGGKAHDLMAELGVVSLHISISDEENQAIAFAIAES